MTSFSISRRATASRTARRAFSTSRTSFVASSMILWTSTSISRAVRSLYCRSPSPSPLARNIGPERPWKLTRPSRLMPNSFTMLRAIRLTCSRSLVAPLEISSKINSSASVPPRATLILLSSSFCVIR